MLTGKSNVWLAAQLTNLSIVAYFACVAIYVRHVPMRVGIGILVFATAVAYVLSQTVFKTSIETAESNAYRRVAKGLRNPRRLRDAPLRISFLTLSVFFFYPLIFSPFLGPYITASIRVMMLSSYAPVVLVTIVLYVLACDPLPPCPAKLKEKIRGFISSLVPAVSRPA